MQTSGPQPASTGFRALMRNRGFVNLWAGQLISQLADKVFFVLLIALVVDYQPPHFLENFSRASVMIANTLPAVFFGSAAGIFVDRWSKKQILWLNNLGRGLLVLLIPILPKFLIFLLIIAFLESILTQFFAPAEQAVIPILVPHETLMPANALFTTTMMGSLVIGFAIGEPLLTWADTWGGNYGGEILVGGLYILASLILFALPLQEPQSKDGLDLHPWNDLKQGLKYVKKNHLLNSALIQLTILYCVFAALSVLAIGLAAEIGLKPTQFGFLLAAAGVGLILGAGILGQWGYRLHHRPLPLFGFLSMSLVLMVFSYVDYLWLGLVLSLLLGVGAAFVGVPMQTLIQLQTPPEMRGKVFGVQNNVVNIALSLPLAIAGLLADAIGLRWVLVSMGVIVATVGIWAWRNTQKVLQNAI
ncbi:MAG: MFS transporter [Acaryochloridaceae cyanobacterium RU_4_10]|nr:MFS transporter [Acaryochloridaceae cyanobacterium RU_4_10]